MNKKIAILGAGNGGYAMAADLSMVGYEVNLYEYPDFSDNLKPIIEKGGIEIISRTPAGKELELPAGGKTGFVKIKGKVTSNAREAIKDTEIIMLVVPAFGREAFIREFAPYLEDGQIIVIWPAYFGALQCAKLLKDLGVDKNFSIAETESLIYNCTKLGGAKVYNKGNKENLLLSILPTTVGIKVPSIKTQIEAFYGAKGSNLYETLLNCYAYEVQGAPTTIEDRYVTEDVPYGLVSYALLGEQIGVPVDNLKAMAYIGCAVTGKDFWNEGMNMEKAGLAGMSIEQIKACIQ